MQCAHLAELLLLKTRAKAPCFLMNLPLEEQFSPAIVHCHPVGPLLRAFIVIRPDEQFSRGGSGEAAWSKAL